MANSEVSILVKIKEQGSQALKDIGSGLEDIALKAAATSAAITAFIGLAVKDFAESQAASNVLAQSIRNQGLDVDKLQKKYEDLADAIQDKTTLDNEAIKKGIALTQSMIGQQEVTEDLIKATTDFAAAKGMDLVSAFDLVSKSIGTNVNALQRYGIEINTQGTVQEKLKNVTDILRSKFDGFAEAQARGLGVLPQLKNAFDDFLKVLGKQFEPFIVKAASSLKEFIKQIQNDAFAKYTAIVLATSAAITGFIGALGGLIALFPTFIAGLNLIKATLSLAFLNPLGLMVTAISTLIGAFQAWKNNLFDIQQVTFGVFSAVKGAFVSFVQEASNLFSNFGSLLKGAFSLDIKEVDASFKKISETISKIKNDSIEAYKDGYQKRDEIVKASIRNEIDLNKEKLENEKKDAEAAARAKQVFRDEQNRKLEEENIKWFIFHDAWEKQKRDEANSQRIDAEIRANEEIEKARQKSIENLNTAIVSFTQGGLRDVSGKFLGFLTEDFIPGMGNAVVSVFRVLSQNTEDFKKMLDGLFSPEFVKNILENLTYLIEQLPSILTNIINYLADNMPAITERLIQAIIANLPEITAAFMQAFIKLSSDPNFIAGMAAAIGKGLIAGIWDALGDMTEAFKKALSDALSAVSGGLSKGIKGGLGGIVQTVGDISTGGITAVGRAIGLAHGGLIPAYADGGLIDNQIARVSAGEFIVNKDSSAANLALLNSINNSNGRSVGTGNNIVINVNGGLLGDRESARQLAKALDEELYKLRLGNESRGFDRSLY